MEKPDENLTQTSRGGLGVRKHERKLVFPFTAIVGQEKAKLALLCCAVDPTIGGVLLSGEKGTGKSTLVRALSQVLPEIEVVDGCPFNCNPHNPLEMCDACYDKLASGGKLKVAKRKMKVVDLPLSITVDRLVGTIDIKKALKEGVRALQPGLLAEANRNILYIDEVNLLDDYVADVLLDAAAMGWNIIEREGISFRHPARFILVGSMNPEEGELRPQLLDRFGLYVPIEALNNPEERAEIVRRVEEFHADPTSFYKKYEDEEKQLRNTIIKAREIVKSAIIDDDLLKLLIETIIKLNIKTHRAEITTVKTAKAIAALHGRRKVTYEDLK
ncbi:MAG: magnesium chelatase, partial [Candidatus Methanomethylicota archaeon]